MVLSMHTFRHSISSTLSLAKGAEFAGVRLERDILWPVGTAHPMRKPMIELSRRLLCICRISVRSENGIFLSVRHSTRTIAIRYTRQRRIHFTGALGRD